VPAESFLPPADAGTMLWGELGWRMDKPQTIARLNIDHYKRLLTIETDPTKRNTIARLLAEEEAKLRKLEGDPKGKEP